MTTAEILKSDVEQAIATFGNALIVIWHGHTTVANVGEVDQACRRFAQSRSGGFGLVTIIEESAPMPASDARDALARLLESQTGNIKVSVVAFEGTGFRAAAVRSVVTGLTMVARQAYPHKVFATVEEAMAWMAPQMPTPTTASEMARGISDLRETLAKRRAAG